MSLVPPVLEDLGRGHIQEDHGNLLHLAGITANPPKIVGVVNFETSIPPTPLWTESVLQWYWEV